MMKRQCFLLAIFILFSASVTQDVWAAAADDAVRQDIQIRQRIGQEKEDLERQREMQEINRSRYKSSEVNVKPVDKSFVEDGVCRAIKQFVVSGNDTLSVAKFTAPNQGQCLTKTDLKNIKDAIENYYIERGYILARVYFDTKKILQGEIDVIIEEGKISDLQIKDDSKLNEKLSWRRKMQRFFAFGFYDHKTANLRDIEQGLDQINRLSSNDAKMEMTPAVEDGHSDVVINNKIKNITKPSLSINNSGNDNTGKIRESLVLDQDNLIGINDNIYFSHTKSAANLKNDHGIDKKYFKSNYLAVSVPFTYYTLGSNYSNSDYFITTRGILTTVSAGNNRSYAYYLSRVLARSKKYKISTKAEFNKASNEVYQGGALTPNSSRTLTVVKLSLDNVFYTKTGTIFLQAKYNKGTELLGARKDQKNLIADVEHAQFDSYGLYGSISNGFVVPKTNINLMHNLTFDSQYSEDNLFASEQIGIGGRYSVRGFDESSISGDNGYYIKNDLSSGVLQLLPERIKNSSATATLQRLNVSIFYDYGYVRNKIVNDAKDQGYMSGAGTKLSYNGENFKVDLTYAKGLHSPQFLRNIDHTPKDNESIYLDFKLGYF